MTESTDDRDEGPHKAEVVLGIAARLAEREGKDPHRVQWEIRGRMSTGFPPIVALLDFALGMSLWTAGFDARGSGRNAHVTSALVDPLVVCLVALALYAIGERDGIQGVYDVPIRLAADLLADDTQARDVAGLLPGGHTPESRLRETELVALATVLQPGQNAHWQHVRQTALRVLTTNVDDPMVNTTAQPSTLVRRFTQIRHHRVRRSWYLHPDLPSQVPEGSSEGLV